MVDYLPLSTNSEASISTIVTAGQRTLLWGSFIVGLATSRLIKFNDAWPHSRIGKGWMTHILVFSFVFNLQWSLTAYLAGVSQVAVVVETLPANRGDGFNLWVGNIPWRRAYKLT